MYEVAVEVMDEVSRAVAFRYRRHVAQAVTNALSGRYRPRRHDEAHRLPLCRARAGRAEGARSVRDRQHVLLPREWGADVYGG